MLTRALGTARGTWLDLGLDLAHVPDGPAAVFHIAGSAAYTAKLLAAYAIDGEDVDGAALAVGTSALQTAAVTASALTLAAGAPWWAAAAVRLAEGVIGLAGSQLSPSAVGERIEDACTTPRQSHPASPEKPAAAPARTDKTIELPEAPAETWSQAVPKQALRDAVRNAIARVREGSRAREAP